MKSLGSPNADEELTRLQAEFCKGMAHPKRIQILHTLKGGEKSVSELARATGIPQANLSQHLSLLRQFGLLEARREGTTIYYAISDKRIVEACDLVRSCIGERLRRSQLVLAVSH
ncbi:MAG TPA: metalloregulator ArsR/SmtB family transcription factor [Nitrososphaerales archaeon]|nr:metalloregulator ArsR/SmtB family transcription factor [Nitrososphaerales archaeon]